MLSGDKLRFLRYSHGKTQKEIAEWCGVSSRYVGMIEYGDETPSQEVYHAWLNCCYGIGEPLKRKKSSTKTKTDRE